MMNRHTPPGRKSISCIVVVKPFGPHQFTMCFGSLHNFQTSSRGASNTRLAAISRAAVSLLFATAADIFLLLFLQIGEVFVETIECVFPEAAVVRDPVGDLLERAGVEAARTPLRVAAARDQAGMLRDFEVLRDCRQAHVKWLGQPCYRR